LSYPQSEVFRSTTERGDADFELNQQFQRLVDLETGARCILVPTLGMRNGTPLEFAQIEALPPIFGERRSFLVTW